MLLFIGIIKRIYSLDKILENLLNISLKFLTTLLIIPLYKAYNTALKNITVKKSKKVM